MEVYVAENSGFCMGVERALSLASKNSGYTIGPLVHNSQVMKKLGERGIKSVNSLDEILEGNLIVRAHGLPHKIICEAKRKGLKVIDATCPFVKSVQNLAKKLQKENYQIIIIGDKEHAEVEGISKNVQNAIVIENVKQVKKFLEDYKKIGVVCQTTQSFENFKKVVNKLLHHTSELKIYNTICQATYKRQKSALQLAKKVNLMLVVGGFNSANTSRLAEICKKETETKHIETIKDVNYYWFRNKEKVGITAGASTPDWVIEEVVNKVKEYQ